MSGHPHQEYHHHPQHQHEEENMFTFSSNNNGFDQRLTQQEQIRRENNNKLSSLVAGHEDPSATAYETTGMLSEMFNFGPGAAQEILDYRRAVAGLGSEWYGSSAARQLARDSMGGHHPQQHNDPPPPPQHHQISSINAESAAAMQLFLTNPPPRSPSPPPPPPTASSSTLHMLLPSPPNQLQPPSGFHPGDIGVHPSAAATPSNPNFWGNPPELSGIINEGQGLSLSLSCSLQQLEAAKQVQEFRDIGTGDHSPHNLFFNQTQPGVGASSSTSNSSPRHFIKHLAGSPQQPILHNLEGVGAFGPSPGHGPNITIQYQVHPGFGSASTGVVNALRSSKYAKPAQELLEEFCSVGRGQIKKAKLTRQNSSNPNPNPSSSTEGGGNDGSSSTKDPNPNPPPPLSPADRIEHQRRKVKLLSMLDEVDRRYNHYCEQMQMVVNSFDMVLGFGAAIPYTALAQKAMSRHFRCLKDAIQAQLKQSCELLGEKDPTTSSGLTRGETPRLKMLEQSLRQQRVFHQMGMMDQEAWRPQRGLPERSVNVLRAWLFEHFLHPYPSDADKHLLARQTGLSRNQVSNWFINARVRLWKPMIEEMYQQEAKEAEREEEEERDYEEDRSDRNQTSTSTSNTTSNNNNNNHLTATIATAKTQQQQQQEETQKPMPSSSSSATHNNYNAATATATATASDPKRSTETMTTRPGPPHHDTDPSSLLPIHHRYHHHQPPPSALTPPHPAFFQATTDHQFGENAGPPTMIRFGAATGDVSLTLGLRHAGNNNAPDKTAAFSLGDFGSC